MSEIIFMAKQKAYCEVNKFPMFVSSDGKCWNCKKQIADTDTHLITGCPYCNRTFCD